MVNDISVALDKKQHCASLFIDLSKAFDTVDHDVLKLRLLNLVIGLCIRYNGLCSDTAFVCKGVPQGSVLGPLLFTFHINIRGQNVSGANFHFYADDTGIYCCVNYCTGH